MRRLLGVLFLLSFFLEPSHAETVSFSYCGSNPQYVFSDGKWVLASNDIGCATGTFTFPNGLTTHDPDGLITVDSSLGQITDFHMFATDRFVDYLCRQSDSVETDSAEFFDVRSPRMRRARSHSPHRFRFSSCSSNTTRLSYGLGDLNLLLAEINPNGSVNSLGFFTNVVCGPNSLLGSKCEDLEAFSLDAGNSSMTDGAGTIFNTGQLTVTSFTIADTPEPSSSSLLLSSGLMSLGLAILLRRKLALVVDQK
jgi:hypothetical protein